MSTPLFSGNVTLSVYAELCEIMDLDDGKLVTMHDALT